MVFAEEKKRVIKVGVLQVDRCNLILWPHTFENAFGHAQLERKRVKETAQDAQVQER